MDKTLTGLIGAVGMIAAAAPAQVAMAAPAHLADALAVTSYAELLKPIPNALALIEAADAQAAQDGPAIADPAAMLEVRYYHHHHHHHHRYYRRRHYHHHHHHGIVLRIR